MEDYIKSTEELPRDIPRLMDLSVVQTFIKKARENGFTDDDIRWVLREMKKDYLTESRKPGLHFGLITSILKEKTSTMIAARRIVCDVCQGLGIKKYGVNVS